MIAATLARFAPYKLLIEIAVIGALLLLAADQYHQFLEHERDIGGAKVQKLWDAQKLVDKQAADKLEADWRTKYEDSITQGAENAKKLRTDANAAFAASERLRDTDTSLQRILAGASAETARQYAGAYQAIFADCVGRYRAMGETAQGHYNDVQTLEAAFPRNPAKVPP